MPRTLTVLIGLVTFLTGASAQEFGTPQPLWVFEVGPMTPGVPFDLTATVTVPPDWYQDADSPFLVLEPEGGVTVLERSSSPPAVRAGKSSFTGTFTLKRRLVVPVSSPDSTALAVRYGWQICQVDGVCLLPQEGRATVALTVVPPPAEAFWLALLGAFVGGLLLNVMPCVFPVVVLKSLAVARSGAMDRQTRRRDALAFAAGGFGSLTALGLVTAAAAAAGQRWDWGFTFQQPAFVWALVLVFWAFALQLWGVWTWRGSPFALSQPWRGGWLSSLAAGAFLVVSAAPCTAPLLGPALGFAFAQPPAQIPLFFAAAAAGLVAPLLVLLLLPGLTRWIPRPGRWLVVVERLAGALLAATAIYLVWVVVRQTGGVLLAVVLLAGVAVVAAAKRAAWKWTSVVAAAVLVGSLVLVTLPAAVPPAVPGWQTWSPQALSEAQASGRTVLVDATAAWCATCQVNEWSVLERSDVAALLARLGILKLRADYTLPDPAIRQWLTDVGRAGLPVYALYRPGQPVYLFPELLTDENFTRRLEPLAARP